MNIRKISIVFQIILWQITFNLSLIWVFYPNPSFKPEPLTLALGLISATTSMILNKHANTLKVEEFCVVKALLIGYMNNFVKPVLSQIIKNNKEAIFYILKIKLDYADY